jgi:hypothetical protein
MTVDVSEAKSLLPWYDVLVEAPYQLEHQMQWWCMDRLGPTDTITQDGRRRWIRFHNGHRHPSMVLVCYCFALGDDAVMFRLTWLDDACKWSTSHHG